MSHLLIFGPGYTADRLAQRVNARGWRVSPVGRAMIDDSAAVHRALATATHILSSVPPAEEGDPVLARFADVIAASPARWVGYLSSTGVYGDTGGGWIDETAPILGRRPGRNAADSAWQAIHPEARVFRLPGIYGPGRSALDRLAQARAHRIDLPGQVFSRIHVDDVGSAVLASFERGPPGIYNVADDLPCPQNDVVAYAADLTGIPLPPLCLPQDAGLSPQALAFYAENRRVANGKAMRLLGWRPRYPDYRSGLRSLMGGLSR